MDLIVSFHYVYIFKFSYVQISYNMNLTICIWKNGVTLSKNFDEGKCWKDSLLSSVKWHKITIAVSS